METMCVTIGINTTYVDWHKLENDEENQTHKA